MRNNVIILLAATQAIVLAAGLPATPATAGWADNGVTDQRSSSVHLVALHRHQLSRRQTPALRERTLYGAFAPQIPAHGAYPYVYAWKRGTLDEACNLPTSACPNDQRDVQ